jgi:RHS repeat-associated protein
MVKDRFRYDPFGGNPGGTGWSAPVGAPFRFAGGSYSVSTGLYKFGERYYDATQGRWTQQDPLDQPLEMHGWNRYVYVGDDPVNFTDVRGLCWVCDVASAAAGAVGGVAGEVVCGPACAIAAGAVAAGLTSGLTHRYIAHESSRRSAKAGITDAVLAIGEDQALRTAARGIRYGHRVYRVYKVFKAIGSYR